MVTMLGLNADASMEDGAIGWSGIDIPAEVIPIVTSISSKRDTLRRKAVAKDIFREDLSQIFCPEQNLTEEQKQSEAPFKNLLARLNQDLESFRESTSLANDILKLSDRIRNVDLFDLGVYLEDRDGDQPARKHCFENLLLPTYPWTIALISNSITAGHARITSSEAGEGRTRYRETKSQGRT